MELLIVKEQPLFYPEAEEDEKLNRTINAKFAITAALSLISCMISDATKEFAFSCVNVNVEERVTQLIEDHVLWLEIKNLHEFPMIINAQFFEALFLICNIPIQINGF